MKKSRFTRQQVAFARQGEDGVAQGIDPFSGSQSRTGVTHINFHRENPFYEFSTD